MEELAMERFAIEEKEELLNELMKNHGQEILQLVYSYVKNKEIAEDLTQDIFVKCYKSLHTYKGNSKIKTWLWRIAINHCKDFLKSWYNNHVYSQDIQSFEPVINKENVEETVIQNDEDLHLISAVFDLPLKYREVIYLYYFEELQIKEIASVIEIKENTVKTRLRKGKEILRKRLEE